MALKSSLIFSFLSNFCLENFIGSLYIKLKFAYWNLKLCFLPPFNIQVIFFPVKLKIFYIYDFNFDTNKEHH